MEPSKILIVDDKPENLLALADTLEELGADVLKAASGNDAIKATLNHDFALMILDVLMPEMDGYELAKILRAREETKRIPIIFLTAIYSDKEHVFKGYQSGAVDYLVKPYDPQILLNKTRVFIQLDQQKSELKGLNRSLEQRVEERTAELVKANEELVKMQKLESLGLLAGGIAHDFNNILAGIMNNAYLVKGSIDKNSKACSYLERVEEGVRTGANLIRQILTFSKGGEPVKRVFFVSDLITDSVNLVLSGSKSNCELNISEDLWLIDADRGQINQVLSNIIINANQSMPDGGNIHIRAVNINIDADDLLPLIAGRFVKISIIDQGDGIREEDLNQIFDPYFTTRGTGYGLGLSITLSIVKKHDGHISVETKPGDGTTFHLYLPASSEKTTKHDTLNKSETDGVKETVQVAGSKLLIMDDDAFFCKAYAQVLNDQGHEVDVSSNGHDAIDLYKKSIDSCKPYSTVLLDLTIPGGMGGVETIRKLLEIDPDVSAIVCSGYSEDPVMANFKEYGFKCAIAKPFEIDDLIEMIQAVATNRTLNN
jgi:two-component system, cell cycle sensor histidine kinase and response regulator CckA